MQRNLSHLLVWALIPSAVIVLGGCLYMMMMFGLTQQNWLGLAFWLIPLGVAAYLLSLIVLLVGSLLINSRDVG